MEKNESPIQAVLGCEIASRPPGAPGIADLLPYVKRVVRGKGIVSVDFRPEAAETVEAFVAAERLCCSGLDWRLHHDDELRLTVGTHEWRNSTRLVALEDPPWTP